MNEEYTNPYVGPRTFTGEERKFFFGREREARDLLSLVVSERMVLFFAQSGAGKSSLLNARLIPHLVEQEGFLVLPVGRVSGEIPDGVGKVDNIFIFNLLLSLEQSQQNPERFANMSLPHFLAHLTTLDLRSFFYAEPEEADAEVSDVRYVEPPHILIIDQFEEILNTHLNRWEDREGFFQQLNQAMIDDPKLWVVLTMREDYIAGLQPYARIMHNNMRARFYMKRMEASAAQKAVEMPAELGVPKRTFAEEVAKNLVNDLRQIRVQGGTDTEKGQFIEPVQLQVVCFQLWQNLKGADSVVITQDDVDKLGDVDTALASFYEQSIAQAVSETAVSEIELRSWFDDELITEAATRGTVYQGNEETAGMRNEVVRVLADQYLLRAEMRAGGTWYELVHDRFVSPILQANQTWRLQQSPLIRAAEEWAKNDKPVALLILGDALKQALATNDMANVEPVVREYLEACREAQRQLDLERHAEEQAKLAEEERQKAEAQAKTARKLRWLSIGLVFFVILAVFAAFSAFNQASIAEAESTRAVEQQQLAEQEEQKADEQRATAVAAQATAVFLRDIAEDQASNAVVAREEAVTARETAEAGQEALSDALSEQVSILEAVLATPVPSPPLPNSEALTQTPSPQQTVTATSPTEISDIDFTATVQTQNLVNQLDQIRVTQTAVAQEVVAQESVQDIIIGYSVENQPITAVRLGNGQDNYLFVGGIHAGTAPSSVDLVHELASHYEGNLNEIPSYATLYFIPSLNPDSIDAPRNIEGRFNANGVDINRNWGCDWQVNPTISGRTYPGAGGTEAFSEPETIALKEFIEEINPKAVILWDAPSLPPGSISYGKSCDSETTSSQVGLAYAMKTGYKLNPLKSTPGDITDWLDQQGVPATFVILPQAKDFDMDLHKQGINAVLALATLPALADNLYFTEPVMQGDDVRLVQQQLSDLGYDEVGNIDGIFGSNTENAVKAFQQDNSLNLNIDGIVGPMTWYALFASQTTEGE